MESTVIAWSVNTTPSAVFTVPPVIDESLANRLLVDIRKPSSTSQVSQVTKADSVRMRTMHPPGGCFPVFVPPHLIGRHTK